MTNHTEPSFQHFSNPNYAIHKLQHNQIMGENSNNRNHLICKFKMV